MRCGSLEGAVAAKLYLAQPSVLRNQTADLYDVGMANSLQSHGLLLLSCASSIFMSTSTLAASVFMRMLEAQVTVDLHQLRNGRWLRVLPHGSDSIIRNMTMFLKL